MTDCDEALKIFLRKSRFNLWIFRFGFLAKQRKIFEDGWRAAWLTRDILDAKKPAPTEKEEVSG